MPFKEALYRPESLSYLKGLDQPVIYMDSAEYAVFVRQRAVKEQATIRRLNLRME